MASTSVISETKKKKPGPARTGKGTPVLVRLHEPGSLRSMIGANRTLQGRHVQRLSAASSRRRCPNDRQLEASSLWICFCGRVADDRFGGDTRENGVGLWKDLLRISRRDDRFRHFRSRPKHLKCGDSY